jgi:cell division protein FtsQ
VWDNPFLLRRITQWLSLISIVFLLLTGIRMAMNSAARIDRVEVLGAPHHSQTLKAIPGLVSRLSGDFFSLDLANTRADFESLPWVRSVTVARIWPDRLVIRLEEHVPAAAWNDLSIMSTRGDLFPARPWEGMPKVYAPEGMEYEVASQMGRMAQLLTPYQRRVQQLSIDPLGSWSISLDNGTRLILGREQMTERLARFLRYMPQITHTQAGGDVALADLRYPNGFAVVHGATKPIAGSKT